MGLQMKNDSKMEFPEIYREGVILFSAAEICISSI